MDSDAERARVRDRRIQYEADGLELADLSPVPMQQWHLWHTQAFDASVPEPNAMVVSTVDVHGAPDARLVLVRDADRHGFTFFTNYESAKSQQLSARPVAAATFSWLELHRQVRVRGSVERVSDRESDEYFASRPRASQLGAWTSPQSEVLRDRHELMDLYLDQERRFAGKEVPRPAHWGGWRIRPNEWEFWQGRPSRLHDRFRYRPAGDAWRIDRLAP